MPEQAKTKFLSTGEIVDIIDNALRLLGIVSVSNLDVALSTRALESGGNLDSIKAKTDNLDAALTSLFGTLGQKTMAGSAPVVLASDQVISVKTLHDLKTYASATISTAAAGNTTLVSAVASKVTKVHALSLQSEGTVTVLIQDGAGGTTLDRWSFQAREGAVKPMVIAPACWFKTSVNTILNMNLSAAIQTQINLVYSSDDSS